MEMTLEPVPTVTPTLKEKFIANGDTDAVATAKVDFIETKREWMNNNLARRIGPDADQNENAKQALQAEHDAFMRKIYAAPDNTPENPEGMPPPHIPNDEPAF